MYVIVRMSANGFDPELNDVIGPFDSQDAAYKFADAQMADLNGNEFEVIGLSSPNGYGQ